jgi:hypothetical protein
MKNRSFDDGLTYFYNRRIHGTGSSNNMLEWAKPESEWEGTESVIEDILRWADDGGQILDLGNLMAGSDPDKARERADE